MQLPSDAQWIRDYAAHGSDPAFAGIVARHTDLVYSAALRQTGSPELAREIAQSVFTDLARKAPELAGRLAPDASLAGWLYRGTRFATLSRLRDERRRAAHERQFMEHFHPTAGAAHPRAAECAAESAPDWQQVAPVLDEAMAELGDADREAVVLRYFQNQDFQAVARALGVSEAAAQKRVSRAVERLRAALAQRGVTAGAQGLVVLIAAQAVLVAPAGLSAALATAALAGITVAATGTATIISMSWINAKSAAAIIGAAIIAGTVTYLAQQQKLVQSNAQQRALVTQQAEAVVAREAALAALRLREEELVASRQDVIELARLRNEVAQLRRTADSKESTTAAIVALFKQALSSTPEVEYFVASAQNLRRANMPKKQAEALEKTYKAQGLDPNAPFPPTFYEGAKSAKNYFLSTFLSTNLPGNGKSDLYTKFVSGRFGSNSYRVEAKVLGITSDINNGDGLNSVAILTESDDRFVSQIFHMGVGTLVDGTANWRSNEFTGTREGYGSVHGQLTISNNLPFTLHVRGMEGDAPGYIVRYVYPDPPQSHGGFPTKMITLDRFQDGWQPSMEIILMECRLSQTKLETDFFSPAKFLSTNVVSTNIYSNGTNQTLRAERHGDREVQIPKAARGAAP